MFAIAKLATCMLQNTNLLRMLNIDTPFVKDMKNVVDKVKDLRRREDLTVNREPVPGALTIPFDSIAGRPQESTAEERAADRPVF